MVTNENVADAAVVGIKDEEAGELPKAFVVPKPGKTINPEELVSWVHGKFLQSIKILSPRFSYMFLVHVNRCGHRHLISTFFPTERVAPHKRLRGGVEVIESVPRSPAGKILRRKLREEANA